MRIQKALSFREFIAALKKFSGPWKIRTKRKMKGCIRCWIEGKEYTPLTAVAWMKSGVYCNPYQIPQTLQAIPISEDLGQLVVYAEDGMRGYDSRLKRAMPIAAVRRAICEAVKLPYP